MNELNVSTHGNVFVNFFKQQIDYFYGFRILFSNQRKNYFEQHFLYHKQKHNLDRRVIL